MRMGEHDVFLGKPGHRHLSARAHMSGAFFFAFFPQPYSYFESSTAMALRGLECGCSNTTHCVCLSHAVHASFLLTSVMFSSHLRARRGFRQPPLCVGRLRPTPRRHAEQCARRRFLQSPNRTRILDVPSLYSPLRDVSSLFSPRCVPAEGTSHMGPTSNPSLSPTPHGRTAPHPSTPHPSAPPTINSCVSAASTCGRRTSWRE